ncbi:FtsX-like permease family protein [Puniceicoccales bacterium CK1056]|uniref:FtsX-like permease family protein n=1 Tax=Oceanipulchritudo coccoides TaxID=2706888 RepID=A0A6B2M3C7_9BACT|nr:ABC transporter permease [Oceanipulchritudo coccoides]NDV62916.1 FtsX-like permease family protein [Oceanipulchritudo coccoides]
MRQYFNLFNLAAKQAWRHKTRSILTILGVAVGMFLFSSVETMQAALSKATSVTANDTTLVVYRENRFCPATSRLPEHYLSEIRKIDGVAEAIPIQVAVNNCGASLDVIAFRGVPRENLQSYNPDLELLEGSYDDWMKRSDGALVGQTFAIKRNLNTGDTFEAVGVRVVVSGIIRSPNAQDNNVAYVHLPFLQQASRVGLGTVTQFNVRVTDPSQLDPVAEKIDALFKYDSAPTITRPEKAFFAQTAKDMVEMIGFTRWLGFGAVLGVLGLVANALLLASRSRIKEGAILQTIGFQQQSIGLLVVFEGILLGLAGGILGSFGAAGFFSWQRFTFGSEGLTLALNPSSSVTLAGIVIALVLALLSSVWPAFEAARRPIVESLRDS